MEHLMNIVEVGKTLGLSPRSVIRLVQSGELSAYRTYGGSIDRSSVSETTFGLRFRPTEVRQYLDSTMIR